MNVQELLDKENISYVPKGADFVIRCINPDHEDRNPSLRVDTVTGIFQCLSCEFKGNIFTHFGERANILQIRREKLKRQIASKRSESMGVEYPKGYTAYTGDYRGISAETYKHFGAFQHHDPEYIGRVVFPIIDISGRVRAFQGRHMSDKPPKYLTQPPKAKLPLYPIAEPLDGSILLVEGIYDVLNLYDKGLTNATCCFGITNVTHEKLALLYIQGVQSVDIFFDGEPRAQKEAEKIKIMCEKANLLSRNVFLEDTDPGALTYKQVQGLKRKLYG
jgi:DNA primase